ncbi:MAG: hypothetical protein JW902_03265 [Syntrophaceae bacterium]|nr:hypothetical protein [Syntrophaceae bacterium]
MDILLNKIITEPLRNFLQKLADFLPNLFSALIVFIVGLLLASAVKIVILKLFKLLKLDTLCSRMGISETMQKMALKEPPEKIIGRFFYWLTVIVFFVIALYLLQVPAIEQLLEKLLLYLPNVLIAAVILVVGVIFGNFLGRATLIASVNAGIGFAGFLCRGIKTIIILLAFVMAMEQLGIARSTVLAAFTIMFGGLVFALALALGLGGKDIARRYLERRLKQEDTDKDQEDEIKHI